MKKIFYLLATATLLLGETKAIPFGIKDICSPFTKEDSFSVCYEENNFKWLSYSFKYDANSKYNYDLFDNLIVNSSNKFKTLKQYQVNAISLVPIINKPTHINIKRIETEKDNIIVVISNTNLSELQKLKKEANKEIKKTDVKNINIIEGVVLKKDSFVDIEKKNYTFPQYYYQIITDIDKKKIINSYLLDMDNSNFSKTTVNEIKNLSKVNFLYKIKE